MYVYKSYNVLYFVATNVDFRTVLIPKRITNFKIDTMKKGITIILVLILTSIVNHSFGQASLRDSSFGVYGLDTIMNTIRSKYVDVIVQPDQKIVYISSDYSTLFRINKNGGRDVTFGNNGVVEDTVTTFTGLCVAIQPDGKILVGGQNWSTTQIVVNRYLSNGIKDVSFGVNGTFSYALNSRASKIVVQTNGKIIVASELGFIFRLSSIGILDNTFANAGIYTSSYGRISDMVLQPDDKIIVAGGKLLRFNSNGTIDQSFATNGVFNSYQLTYHKGLALLSDGSIMVNDLGSRSLLKLNSSGVLDITFGVNGKATLATYPKDLVVQPDGKCIVLAVEWWDYSRLVLHRFNFNGSIDATFGNGGQFLDSLSGMVRFDGAAWQNDGHLIVCGTNTPIPYINDSFPSIIRYNTIAPDSVWPGDADHDGIADNNDLLPIGVAYGLGGPVRTSASIVWQAEACQDWGLQLLSGTNAKHVDCNGNGTINADDTLAIVLNFGLTHAKKEDQPAAWRAGIPGLNIVLSKDTLRAGDTLVASIQLGDASLPVSNIYGLAFTYNYDALVVDTTKTEVLYPSSWLATTSERITIIKDFKTTGQIKTAVTRINHVNRSGNGEIAQIKFKITTDNISGKNLMYYNNSNFISAVTAIDSAGNPIDLNAGVDSALVEFTPTGIRTIEQFQAAVYPNPTSGKLFIKSDEALLEHVKLRNLLGETVVSEVATGSNKTIDVSGLANGVYILHLETNKGELYRRIVISK